MIKKINHIALVVPEMEEGKKFWTEVLGLQVEREEHVADQDVDVAFLPVGESDIELLHPLSKDSGVAKFLQKRGPGIHHICLEVNDIEATLAQLLAAEIPLIDETPRIGAGGRRVAFIHPKGTGGVLVELYE
ncbi:MAG: methylmalonyl-CoA epimerase [Chloroflexota bacterium]